MTYPVGSVYVSVNNTSPASLFGGTWEPIEADQTLWTTTTAGEGGKTISAGLPEIDGNIYQSMDYDGGSANGVFARTDDGKSVTASSGRGAGIDSYNISFKASRYNSIYGNSTTVQPPAVKVYMWQRIVGA